MLLTGKCQQVPAPLSLPIQQTVENTGVKLKGGKEATSSTSLSLVCFKKLCLSGSVCLSYIYIRLYKTALNKKINVCVQLVL